MNQHPAHHGVMPHSWLQHHAPWLMLLAMVLGLFGVDADVAADAEDLNG